MNTPLYYGSIGGSMVLAMVTLEGEVENTNQSLDAWRGSSCSSVKRKFMVEKKRKFMVDLTRWVHTEM